jgi:hypothetical protein
LGPLTGRPWTAGILTWLAVGAVGNLVSTNVLQPKFEDIRALPPGPTADQVRREKTMQALAVAGALGTGFFIAQVVGSIAAYRAAKA